MKKRLLTDHIQQPQTKTQRSTAAFSMGWIGVKHGPNSCMRAVEALVCGQDLRIIFTESKSLLMEGQVCQPPTGNHSFI